MLWALLITLLVTKLSGGPEEVFMIPNFEKEIKAHVVDKDRKKEILLVVKEGKKELKSFNKIRKRKLKEIKEMGASRASTAEQILALYETYHDARLVNQSILTDRRIILQNLFTDEEWKQIIEKAVLPSDKAKKKIEKQEGKEEDSVDKVLANIEKSIKENIEDEHKKQEALSSLDKFKTTLNDFIEEGHKMNFEDNDIIRNKNVSRAEFEHFYSYQNQLRYKGSEEFFEMRNSVLENSNEKEWKEIIKSINKFIEN